MVPAQCMVHVAAPVLVLGMQICSLQTASLYRLLQATHSAGAFFGVSVACFVVGLGRVPAAPSLPARLVGG